MNQWIRNHPRTTYWIVGWATVTLLLQVATLLRVLSA